MCFLCEGNFCKFVTTAATELVKHITKHVHEASHRNYDCFICGRQFFCFDNLFNHIRETYTKVEYECVACCVFYSTKTAFDDHECSRTVNLDEMSMTGSESREMEYIFESNIEN